MRKKIAMITNKLDVTGISTVIMNYCLALNKDIFDITIIAGEPVSDKYVEKCKENGIKVIILPNKKQYPIKYYKNLFSKFRKNKYDLVHVHGNSSIMANELTLARLAGIKSRIAHNHNSKCFHPLFQKIINPYFNKIYTMALSCGVLAGEWIYGNNQFTVLPNGFHVEDFYFSLDDRNRVRSELNLNDKFVIGHIGRINDQKNQEYLLRIFEKVALVRKDAVLLIVGTGPDKQKIKDIVNKSVYKDRIILYGETSMPKIFYSAMDLFCFPSKYEGLPVVLLEAQISGLPCVVSDKITKEVDFGNIQYISIDQDPQVWADLIEKSKAENLENRINYGKDNKDKIEKYDIETTVKQLEQIYKNELTKIY